MSNASPPQVIRAAFAVAAGLVAWFAIGTLGNLLLRNLLPGYEAAEKDMAFSLAMLAARLILGAVSSMGGGLGCRAVWRGGMGPACALAFLLLLLFVPVHAALWNKFPLWYHAVFLVSLAPLTLLGFRLAPARTRNTT